MCGCSSVSQFLTLTPWQPTLWINIHNIIACILSPGCLSLCLTSDARGSIGWYVRVHCDLRVEDAAVGVGIHLQWVQQLSVVLHPVIVCAALFRYQLGGALCENPWKGRGDGVKVWNKLAKGPFRKDRVDGKETWCFHRLLHYLNVFNAYHISSPVGWVDP